jgi:hypothetical protein
LSDADIIWEKKYVKGEEEKGENVKKEERGIKKGKLKFLR